MPAAPSKSLWTTLTSYDNIRRSVYLVGAIPAAWYFYAGFHDQLGADPVRTLERSLGLWALRLLVIGLAITPLRRIGGPNLIRYRRAIGLLAFAYAALHLFVFVWFDLNLDFSAVWQEIVKRPYITVGFASFLILVPLAITSNNTMIKRIGGPNWNRLHKLVYAACALGAIHFLMLVKTWKAENAQPAIYATLVLALLLFRLAIYLQKRAERSRRAAPAA